MKLSDITGLLGEAATSPERAMMQEILDRINFFFEEPDPDEEVPVLVPRFVHIKIGTEVIKYPLLLMGSLTPTKTSKVRFLLSTDLDLSGHEDGEGNPQIQISLKKGLFGHASHVEIEGEFVGGDQPEAFHQLQDKYNDMIAKALEKLDPDLHV